MSMSMKDELLRRINDDDKYKRIMGSVDEEIAAGIRNVIETFIDGLGPGLDELKRVMDDPDVARRVRQSLKQGATPEE